MAVEIRKGVRNWRLWLMPGTFCLKIFGEIAERERKTIYENVLSLPEENSILVIKCGMWQAGEI